MNIHDIKARIADIEASKGDPETAHGMEDDLYREFIRYIASGEYGGDLDVLAKEVLKTQTINFPRWCA